MIQTLIADPPWSFSDSLPGPTRGAAKNYSTMTLEDIKNFKLPPLADDCRLFLWRVSSMQTEALEVMKAWGFTLKSEMVWLKKTAKGKRHFGMGRQVRNEHEVCLIGVRGKPKVKTASMRSTFTGKTGIHSTKPERFYKIVEELSPGPYAELFARKRRKDWWQRGDELSPAPSTRSDLVAAFGEEAVDQLDDIVIVAVSD